MARITVVIPAFNAECHLGEALSSVREQAVPDMEVLVVDDGSSDGTAGVAGSFSGTLDVRVLRQGNAGPAVARNVGVREASGDLVAFLDADDIMLPGRLSSQLALMLEQPDLGLVFSDLMTFDDRGVICRSRKMFSDPCGGWVLDSLLMDNFITTSTVMAPRERLLEAGLFNEERRISEDFELWLRMAARWKVGYIDRPLVRYRRRRGSLSDNKLVTGRCALDVIRTFWAEHPDYRRARPAVHRRSVGRHLAALGASARDQGDRGAASNYLVRALLREPRNVSAWKSLAKCFLPGRHGSGAKRKAPEKP